MKNKVIMFLFLIFDVYFVNSQNVTQSNQLVVTYEIERSNEDHQKRQYHWILTDDILSIEDRIKMKPLYLDSFSSDSFDKCCNNETIYLFSYNTETKFNFNDDYTNDLNRLKRIISENRKKVQSSTKKWSKGGYKEIIRVFITPISGEFCICENAKSLVNNSILLPKKQFNLNKEFWESEMAKIVFKMDFINNYDFINKDSNF